MAEELQKQLKGFNHTDCYFPTVLVVRAGVWYEAALYLSALLNIKGYRPLYLP